MYLLLIAQWILIAMEGGIAVPIFYLCVLAVVAIIATKKRKACRDTRVQPSCVAPHLQFAILVPAHNEEMMLARLLHSLAALDYPRERYSVYVIADNCTDRTAMLTRAADGIHVYERVDACRRGKGYAIAWMLQILEDAHLVYDAYVILDADSAVVPDFLRSLESALCSGATALHAHNVVMNAGASSSTALRWLALSLMAHVRPLGRSAIGGSSTLGNGMCLSRALLLLHPWRAFSLTEDYEYYLTLVQHGERVCYVPEALVYTHMPETYAQMRTQDIRWESSVGRQPVWRVALRLLRDGVRYHNTVRLEALLELLTPPLSLLVTIWGVTCITALLIRSALAGSIDLMLAAALACYVFSPFYLLHPPRSIASALLHAPGFMIWKVWVYLVLSRSRKHTSQWIRTSRLSRAR